MSCAVNGSDRVYKDNNCLTVRSIFGISTFYNDKSVTTLCGPCHEESIKLSAICVSLKERRRISNGNS